MCTFPPVIISGCAVRVLRARIDCLLRQGCAPEDGCDGCDNREAILHNHCCVRTISIPFASDLDFSS